MKTLKFLMALVITLTSFTLNCYSQWPDEPNDTYSNGNKTTYYYYTGVFSPDLPGVDEPVTGSAEAWWTVSNIKAKQHELVKGKYVGDVTGTIYYTSNVTNYWFIDGKLIKFSQTLCIEDEDGKVYYTSHGNMYIDFTDGIPFHMNFFDSTTD
ncbi:hypothetical protein SLH46_12780 [Draconibacterium sp. IB214405]|uniref:hypothetical protein n=1 Tax=Draconibacterium sp. IB214405 TaxID=3097352 RepID=UPI002A137FC5|nr:hypothetical protein [Draconibacterium sp. IB214405]MDX8340068.1 hypothetical protein [Draconibacterium sp. IB214405]